MNVVSTSPSSTEILYALGVEPVAVSHACDYPPAARELPVVDTSTVDAEASGDRHDQVQAATRDGHLYRMDADTLNAVDPDLVVTQGVCGVCAVDDVLVDETLADLDADPDVLALQASRLAGVFDCIRQVGAVVDREDKADELVADLQDRLAALESQLPDARPRTLVLEWVTSSPPQTAGLPLQGESGLAGFSPSMPRASSVRFSDSSLGGLWRCHRRSRPVASHRVPISKERSLPTG